MIRIVYGLYVLIYFLTILITDVLEHLGAFKSGKFRLHQCINILDNKQLNLTRILCVSFIVTV